MLYFLFSHLKLNLLICGKIFSSNDNVAKELKTHWAKYIDLDGEYLENIGDFFPK